MVEKHVEKMLSELKHASGILAFAVTFAILSFVLGLISHETLNFVPVLAMVATGMSLVLLVFRCVYNTSTLSLQNTYLLNYPYLLTFHP